MNRLQKQRLGALILIALGLTVATGFILFALKQNINVFFTPHQLENVELPIDYTLRLGGMVKIGSLTHDKKGLGINFIVTDFKNEILVRYVGVLPDLFREGKGVIALGHLNHSHLFIATQILAKHDENYMPKNVYRALRENP